MRILILSNLYPPNVVGGYERLCFEVAAALAQRGHSITVLTSRYGGEIADYPGQTVLRKLDLLTGSDIYSPFPSGPAERMAINQANLAALRSAVADVRPDVVFAWNLFFLDASLLAALEQGPVRTVVMLTDNWLLVMRNPHFVSNYFRDCVHGSTRFATSSPPGMLRRLVAGWRQWRGRKPGLEAIFGATFVRDLYAAGGITFPRHRVVHNGVRQSGHVRRKGRDRSAPAEPGTLRLLFAGRLVDLKGAHTAVQALALLSPASLKLARIKLTVLGDAQDADYVCRLRTEISDSGRADDITLAPPVSEAALFDLFDSQDIYLFPSLYEPFSLTLIHALACGIPTVASRTGGNPEIVQDGESGLLFNKGDPADLARAIALLANDPTLRARLSAGGRQTAARFTFERMVEEMDRFLTGRR